MDFFDFIKNNRFTMFLISIIFNFLFLIVCGFLLYRNLTFECICENENIVASNNEEEIIDEKFYVEIKGAVKNPGVYEAVNNNIINDIIKEAGGFTKKAYTKNINLSRKVSNELVIYVYTESEYKKKNEENVVQTTCECPTYDISDCTDVFVSEIITNDNNSSSTIIESNSNDQQVDSENEIVIQESSTNETSNTLININSATKEELMNLSGIGESKADAIIEYRNKSAFKSIDEIKNVSGIGDALFTKIKDNITV